MAVSKEEFEKNRARGFIPIKKPNVIGKHSDIYPEEKKVEEEKGLKTTSGKEVKTVPNMLRQSAETYEERNKIYGNNYKNFGKVMVGLFPKGVKVETVDDWNRMGVFVQMMSKLTRYAENFTKGGHDDSLLDLSVYSSMLRELDMEAKK